VLESLERRLALDASGAISLVADVATTDVNESVEIDVLANDEGPKLEVTSVGEVANGVAEITDEGTILFTPDEGFEGEVTFEYTAENRFGTEATGEVTVTVENDIPLAAHDRAELDAEGVAVIDVLANDTVSDDETLTVTQINGVDVAVDEEVTVDGGMVVVDENGVITFTADDDFEGRTDFEYTVSDEDGETATATVVVTAADFVNTAPVAEADDLTATPSLEDESVVIDVLGNDLDADGDPLTVVAIAGEDVSVGDEVEVEGGVVSLNANGTLTFTPDPEFSGDVAFEYTVSDGLDEATASVTLTVEAVNDPPEAVDDEATVNLDEGEVTIDVLANDTDGEGDELTVTQINGEVVAAGDEVEVDGGLVIINEDGTVTFTANEDFSGETTFEYTVSDGEGEATATVTVTGETDSPLHNPDAPTDVDGDGRTTVRDLLMVVRALRELGFGELPEDTDPEEVGYVDVNNDNLLTVADLVAVARTMRNGHGHDDDGPGNSRNAPGRTGDHPHDQGDDDDDDERGRGNGAQRGRGRG
jgi:hypothetical protein